MTTADDPSSIDIHLHYSSSYEKAVRDGTPDDWIDVAIVTDDIAICGDPEAGTGLTGYACSVQFDLLDAVEAVYARERGVVEFAFGPSWVVFEPHGDTAVTVAKSTTYAGLETPEDRLDIDPSAVVTRDAVRAEVLDTVQGFIDHITALNPEVVDLDTVDTLQRRIEEVRASTGAGGV